MRVLTLASDWGVAAPVRYCPPFCNPKTLLVEAMPLTKIRLQNFRCFADSGPIGLRPLTVIFGRNNAGKSSILQSLLLLRQSLDGADYGDRLNLRGPLYPAGSYADVVHQHRSSRSITMSFDLGNASSESRRFQNDVLWDASGMEAAHLELQFVADEPQSPRLVRCLVETPDSRVEIRRGRGRGGPQELHINSELVGGEHSANFRYPVNQFLPFIGQEPPRRGRPNQKRDTARVAARHVIGHFIRTLASIRAVGPFRTPPFRRYDYQGRPTNLIDLRGENVVYALIEDTMRRGRRAGDLVAAVNRWLRQVGRVRLMPLRRISPNTRLYELRLRDIASGRWANFADVGFGIGQALPVLVEGLRTPEGGLFLVQEPEIHLHPDAQLAMADFLIDLCRAGRRVVVETHSEAVLLRVRKVVAESAERPRSGLKPDDVSVVYVAARSGGGSRTEQLDVDALGRISEWPEGFMEDVTQERLDLLRTMADVGSKD